MAKRSLAHSDNVAGSFFVDSSCIGCGVCTRLAPDHFVLNGSQAHVYAQPQSNEAKETAVAALLSCPVMAIGTYDKALIPEVAQTFPLHLHGDVYLCGFTDERSFGAMSYLIHRAEGNILVDVPRFDPRLVRGIERMGGIKYIYMTHKDDIGAYAQYQSHFNAELIFHEDDCNSRITDVDILLSGEADYNLDDEVKIIVQRGHTKGHTVLLYQNYYLFSGDNLTYTPQYGTVHAFKNYCWYDWNTQLASLGRLMHYRFSYLLPGHGSWYHSSEEKLKKLLQNYLQKYQKKG